MTDLIALSQSYFTAFNAHDAASVKEKYAPDGILRDWNGEHKGSDKVESACAGIFEAVPNIRCDILTMHLSAATNTVIAELSIYINDTTTLLVADVIEYNESGKIKSLRAYNGTVATNA